MFATLTFAPAEVLKAAGSDGSSAANVSPAAVTRVSCSEPAPRVPMYGIDRCDGVTSVMLGGACRNALRTNDLNIAARMLSHWFSVC